MLAQSETPNQRNTHTQNSQYTQKERTDTPTSLSIVSCNKCEHFTPDQIGDGAGIGTGLSMRGEAILQAVSVGEISPEQGKAIMGIIDAQRKNIETTELSLRLLEIERTLKQR